MSVPHGDKDENEKKKVEIAEEMGEELVSSGNFLGVASSEERKLQRKKN